MDKPDRYDDELTDEDMAELEAMVSHLHMEDWIEIREALRACAAYDNSSSEKVDIAKRALSLLRGGKMTVRL